MASPAFAGRRLTRPAGAVPARWPRPGARMKSFYFEGLSYPRTTVSEMVKIARDYGFVPIAIICEPTRYINTVAQFIDEVDGFWEIVWDNHQRVGAEEVLSGMYHVLFRKRTSSLEGF